MHRCLLVVLVGVLIGSGCGPVIAANKGPAKKVCMLKHNEPYSDFGTRSGFDHDVAAAVARSSGRELVPVWIDNEPGITEIDDSDYPLGRLARDECDAVFSVPGPARDSLSGQNALALGEPYYGAAFELLACAADFPAGFRSLRGRKVAIQSQTVAHFALAMVKADSKNYFSLGAAYKGLLSGEAEAALLWGPTSGWQLRIAARSGAMLRNTSLAECGFVKDYQPPAAVRWNLHVATRQPHKRLRTDIDKALATMIAEGELDRIKHAYGIPKHEPFSSTYDLGAINDLQSAH